MLQTAFLFCILNNNCLLFLPQTLNVIQRMGAASSSQAAGSIAAGATGSPPAECPAHHHFSKSDAGSPAKTEFHRGRDSSARTGAVTMSECPVRHSSQYLSECPAAAGKPQEALSEDELDPRNLVSYCKDYCNYICIV